MRTNLFNATRVTGARAAALLCAIAFVVVARPLSAQQPQDTVRKAPAEIIRDKLRGLRVIGAPDTVSSRDTMRAQPQQVRINGNATGNGKGGAPDGAMTRDTIWESLLRLPGYNITEYKGDTAAFRADSGNLNLRGNALVSRDGQQVSAGMITYADSLSLVCGYGKPQVSGAGTATPLASDSLCYDIANRYGVARGATTSISEGALWRMYSTTLVTRGDDYYSNGATFTDCDMPWDHLHYAFTAKQVLAKRNNVLVARDVTLRFADVPVFWLPFMVQSLSQGRRSGILMPRFGINDIARTSTRYSRRIEDVGFYWAINDFMGAEVAFDWMSNNWTALRGSYDYNFLQQFVRGGLTIKQFWKTEGGTEMTLASQNSWDPNERTHVNASANYSSSSSFVKRRSFDPNELNRSIDSNVSMNRRLDWGSVTIGSSRRQYLNDNTVNEVLPSIGLNIASVTLFGADPGEEHWYSNATWTATSDFRKEANKIDNEENTNPTAQTRNATTGNVTSSFSLGNFKLSQNYSLNDQKLKERRLPLTTAVEDSALLPGAAERRNAWGVDLSYQQRLVGSLQISPSLGIDGESLRNEKTGGEFITAPARLVFGATMGGDLYRIITPPFGPFSKIRHKLSPSVTYNYSPKPQADSLQTAAFAGFGNTIERNALQLSLSQTFEAKRRESRSPEQINADSVRADTASGPQRRIEAQPIRLLSISTSAVAYDFVQRRELGSGFLSSAQLSNSFQSDLVSGLSVQTTHELFDVKRGEGNDPNSIGDRKFSPFLSLVGASFSIGSSSRLFRLLHLGGRDSMPSGPNDIQGQSVAVGGVAVDRTTPDYGMIGTRRQNPVGTTSGAVGAWNANLTYSYRRDRNAIAVPVNSAYGYQNNDHTLGGTLNFQPTENWSASWQTNYNISLGAFNDHRLHLVRKLHDWDANFDFIKSVNGNFSFSFSVFLRANPDIKVDWAQNDRPFNTIR